jgi:hypothetical protein
MILSYDLAVPLLGILPKESKSAYNGDTCTPVFVATVFTIAKSWNQSRCPSKGE